MGGFDVDLREAEIEGDEAVITVNALMGGGVIRVPETWGVSMRVAAFMGGHSLKAREGVQPTKTLVVKGVAIMGGIEVRN
jgi:predicted membrane protein